MRFTPRAPRDRHRWAEQAFAADALAWSPDDEDI
jgi:hypothetical protein